MTNIVPLRNTGGFTRMDNQLMDALAAVHLSPAEFKTLHAITRLTVGFNQAERRITADEIAKRINIRPQHVSTAISNLLARRVLYRVGGSRGQIGICDPAEWIFEEPKKEVLSERKSVDSTENGSSNNVSKLPISVVSLPYKKDIPLLTLPTEEINPPQADEPPAKPERKAPFGKAQMLADNPHGLDESLIADHLAVRKAKRTPISQRIWEGLNKKLEAMKAFGVTPVRAMEIANERGWAGFEISWVLKHVGEQQPQQSRHHGFGQIDYTAGRTQNEDGSYDF